ncbi:MAG: hypothetical protein U0790_09485 [Isosphaeraceae bacterium]
MSRYCQDVISRMIRRLATPTMLALLLSTSLLVPTVPGQGDEVEGR